MNTVGDAARNIRDNLKEGWFDDVGVAQLRDNNAIVDRLTPDETRRVVGSLSDDELSHWSEEIHDGKLAGFIGSGGLALDQRRDLLNKLSADLDAPQLERVYRALGTESRQGELLDALASHATDATMAGLVSQLADRTTDKPYSFSIGFAATTTAQRDQDAGTVAILIGHMSQPAAIEQALAALSEPQLEAVLKAGTAHDTVTTMHLGSMSHTQVFDTTALTRMIDAVGRSDDTTLKARVFELASRQIDTIHRTDQLLSPNVKADEHAGAVTDALSALIATDTTGIVTALEQGDGVDSSRVGNGMSSWVASLVRQDDIAVIHELIGKLQAGDDLGTEPAEFLSRFSIDRFGARDFQNASNLGFLIGAVREGISAIDDDAKQQADTLTGIFGTAAALVNIAVPGSGYAGKAAWVVGSALTTQSIEAVTNDLSSGRLNLEDALEQLALPAELVSSDVTNAFGGAINNIERH